jgi:HSP20 family protein
MTWFNALERSWRGEPWQGLARMQAEMDRLFQLANDSYAPGTPPVDVWVNGDEVFVAAELPGFEANDVDISVDDDVLTLRGKRVAPDRAEGARPFRQERGFGEFVRSFRLPFRVDAEAVDARFANGVLEIKLPRAEADRPRRIAVQAS